MSKKRRKGGGTAQKAKRRRKQWYAQSHGAPYKGQATGTSVVQRPLPPDEEMMMDLTATLAMLMLRKRR